MVEIGAHTTDMAAALRRLSSKAGSRIGVGLELESVHQELTCTDVFRKWSTTVTYA